MPKRRNYDKEYKDYHGTEEQKARRAARGRARYKAEKEGKVKKGDGKDIDHKDFNPKNNSKKNTRVMDSKKNRSRQPKHKGKNKGK
jgi:hypothetical protein